MRLNKVNFVISRRLYLNLLFWTFLFIKFVSNSNNFPLSPCPNVFLYKFNGQEWHGEIKAPTSLIVQQQSAVLKVTFTLRVLHNAQTRRADISLINRNMNSLTFHVTFPQRYPLPKLIQIIFGDRLLCSSPDATSRIGNSLRIINMAYLVKSTNQMYSQKPPIPVAQSIVSLKNSPKTLPILPSRRCGMAKTNVQIRSLVFGGEVIQRGEWPWLVAIYISDTYGVRFACGGNLISKKMVLTAAHCVKTSNRYYQPREILLYFGHYNRLDWTEIESIRLRAAEIIIHPDYGKQQTTKDADLAILISDEPIEFNNFIQPVCLWSSEDSDESEPEKGTVVGWGRDSLDRIASTHPRKIELPIVQAGRCSKESEAIASALSNRTFCAGTLDGNGPCYGDSGSGLMIHRDGRWILRGIVSAGLSDANNGLCKLTDYIIFTDIANFLSWIRTYMQ